MTSAFCVHAHFYQPPREDPLSGLIPVEEGAFPYLNWNERIHEQCYKPNSELGNFARISFNVGPTLFKWMSEYDPETLDGIIRQERAIYRITGLPNGMAQAYNHTILPLATQREKQIQINWGLKEFEYRFGHKAAGLWLPEAAVDMDTLSAAHSCGVEYVILAPWQCADTGKELSQPGYVDLGNGKKIIVFFYNQILSTRVSFDPGSTRNADQFLENLVLPELNNGASGSKEKFLLIASDGELYGHHQRFRDQFLMRLTTNAFRGKPVSLITPAVWLQQHPPRQDFTIAEKSSWSCHHGVSRWGEDCGCTPNSLWKAPMRAALNMVAELVDNHFERVLEKFGDPYTYLEDYIQVLIGSVSHQDFISQNFTVLDNESEFEHISKMFKAEYERHRMFTSCGWFFDDFDRIEPRNNIKYAAQAIWFTQQINPSIELEPIIRVLKTVVSPRTNLRADHVFKSHLQAAQTAWFDDSSKA